MGIGKRLSCLLSQKNMKVSELAGKADVKSSTIYSIIKRDNTKVDLDILFSISSVLGVCVEYFKGDNIDMPIGDVTMNIGEWVRQYRKEHGLSMQTFGDMCGLSRAYISILEKGINPTTNKPFSPTIQTVQKIAEVTGLDLNLLDKGQPLIINSPNIIGDPVFTKEERELLSLYHQLDIEDRAEIRGEMKGMLRAEKYQAKSKDKTVG